MNNSIDAITAVPAVQPRSVDRLTTYRPPVSGSVPTTSPSNEKLSFQDVLKSTTQRVERPVEFSRHAIDRLADRAIPMGKSEMIRLGEGVDRACAKGSKTSAVLLDDIALVVAVPTRTVITAVPVHQLKEGILTQIDSVLFA